MEDPSETTLALLAVISFCVSTLCSLIKSAHASFSILKLEELLETEKAKKRLQVYIAQRTELSIATSIVGTIANMIFVVSIILFFSQDGHISNKAIMYSLPLSLLPLIAFAKSLPETLARKMPEEIMRWSFPIMTVFYWLFFWIVRPLSSLAQKFNQKLLRPYHSSTSLEKEILHAVSEGEKEGFFQGQEKDMIEAIIDLREVEAKEIMTPRTDMACISLETSIEEALKMAKENGHSRIPIYRENRDDIVGIFYIKDWLHHWDKEDAKLPLEKLMRKPYFIPETKRIASLLKEFQEQKLHMAIVLDEYGGTAGIVTIEDIMEEIVGEILDEYDIKKFDSIQNIDENVAEIAARMRVDELNESMGIDIPLDDGYETVGGFLFTCLGRIPIEGDTYTYNNIQFTVLNASDRKIDRIKIAKLNDAE